MRAGRWDAPLPPISPKCITKRWVRGDKFKVSPDFGYFQISRTYSKLEMLSPFKTLKSGGFLLGYFRGRATAKCRRSAALVDVRPAPIPASPPRVRELSVRQSDVGHSQSQRCYKPQRARCPGPHESCNLQQMLIASPAAKGLAVEGRWWSPRLPLSRAVAS